MKKLYILLLVNLFIFNTNAQSCLPDGIAFEDQESVNNFQINYPNCTKIDGRVIISGDNVQNLDGLSALNSIGGYLTIGFTRSLTNIEGLGNITSLGGSLKIENTYALQNLTGFNNLTSIGGSLTIQYNDVLTSLTGIEGLTSVGGNLTIGYNKVLTNLTAMKELKTIDGNLSISNNVKLTSITGIANIDNTTISTLYIIYNSILSTCEVQSICNYIAGEVVAANIFHNAEGCNSPQQVQEACQSSVGESNINNSFSITLNPSCDKIIINSLNFTSNFNLSIFNISGQKMFEKKLTNQETEINIGNIPRGIYIVRIQTGNAIMTKNVIKP